MESPKASKQARPPLTPLTSFRFFAALAILIFHAQHDDRYAFLASGVSFFFVLSGFVLTYVHPRIGGVAASCRFLVARLARIWPLHVLTMVVVLILQPFGGMPYNHFFSEFFTNLLLLQCWVPVGRVAMSFNFVSWSISVELFLYFAFPFILPYVSRAPARTILASMALYAVLALSGALLGLPNEYDPSALSYRAFLFCPALHLYQFVLGMAGAVWYSRARTEGRKLTRWSLIEACALTATICSLPYIHQVASLIVGGRTGYAIDAQLSDFLGSLLFAILVYVFAFQAGIFSRIFSHRWMVYLGEISFTIYMIHCIILETFNHLEIFAPPVLPVFKWGLFALAVLLIASILHAAFEKPLRKSVVRLGEMLVGTICSVRHSRKEIVLKD